MFHLLISEIPANVYLKYVQSEGAEKGKRLEITMGGKNYYIANGLVKVAMERWPLWDEKKGGFVA